MSPNALYIYDKLGLYSKLQAAGRPLPIFDIVDAEGRLIQKNDTRFRLHGKQYSSMGIHRGDLQRLLVDAIKPEKVHLGKALAKLDLEGGRLHFKTGEIVAGDYILACDGIHSVARQAMFPAAKLRYSGQTCWRGVAQVELAPDQLANPAELWGNGVRFGYVPLTEGRVYWYGTAVSPPHIKDTNPHNTKQQLLTQYRPFSPFVNHIIESTDTIMRHDLFDLAKLPSWSANNTLLLGDAAHAMTPNMGQV